MYARTICRAQNFMRRAGDISRRSQGRFRATLRVAPHGFFPDKDPTYIAVESVGNEVVDLLEFGNEGASIPLSVCREQRAEFYSMKAKCVTLASCIAGSRLGYVSMSPRPRILGHTGDCRIARDPPTGLSGIGAEAPLQSMRYLIWRARLWKIEEPYFTSDERTAKSVADSEHSRKQDSFAGDSFDLLNSPESQERAQGARKGRVSANKSSLAETPASRVCRETRAQQYVPDVPDLQPGPDNLKVTNAGPQDVMSLC
ncbi:hypothetical protein BDV93DRAFT_514729 [Ceratobasidium sp. AG-I]|nr:hypothetical protein BDV93DRAFT_514729 [Ceratobasidium sp. AG-I]